jgi:hypothetical protein
LDLSAPVLFENDKVRVVDARTKPGERNPMQERSDRVIYHFNAGKTRVHYADGKAEEREFKAGTVEFRKRDTTPSENIGKSEVHNLVINLKSAEPGKTNPVTIALTKLAHDLTRRALVRRR